MVDDSRFASKTFLQNLTFALKYIGDVCLFLLLIIPLYCQWIYVQIFRKKKSIKDQLALVTGGGMGLGRAISLKLASHGCRVVIADIDIDAANKTALDVQQLGTKAKAYKVDVTNANDILCLRDEITKEFGAVDIVINNAGMIAATNLLEDDAKRIEAMVKVNLLGPLLITKYFLEQMKMRKSGHIVSIASMAGINASPYIIAYSATKFGVNGYMQALTEYLRLEKLDENIKTTCVFPFYIKTRQVIVDFLNSNIRFPPLEVDVAAKMIVNAILREDKVLTIPGHLDFFMRLIHVLPLKIQQYFRDIVMREYDFKDPNF